MRKNCPQCEWAPSNWPGAREYPEVESVSLGNKIDFYCCCLRNQNSKLVGLWTLGLIPGFSQVLGFWPQTERYMVHLQFPSF